MTRHTWTKSEPREEQDGNQSEWLTEDDSDNDKAHLECAPDHKCVLKSFNYGVDSLIIPTSETIQKTPENSNLILSLELD